MDIVTEPLDLLYRAAMERSRPMVDDLRRSGWDVQVVLNAPTASKLVLSLEFHLEMARMPIEATETTTSDRRAG